MVSWLLQYVHIIETAIDVEIWKKLVPKISCSIQQNLLFLMQSK